MEGIYLIHTREFIKSNENIYKIGRSNNIECRIRNYPKGSNVLFIMKCKNSTLCEDNLINLFKKKFIQSKYYGNEYFEGDEDLMIDEIYKYLSIHNKGRGNTKTKAKAKAKAKAKINDIINNIVNDNIINNNIVNDNIINNNIVNDNTNDNINNNVNDIIKVKVNTSNNTICPNCKIKFKFPSLLKVHFRKAYHCLLSEDKIDEFFDKCSIKYNQCSKCKKQFTNRQAHLRHNRETKCGRNINNNNTNISNLVKLITPDVAKDIIKIIINKNL
jgi:hypothetical protein